MATTTATKPVTTNDLKKGTKVQLRNGWKAELMDNRKGNTRMANVFGDFTEMGSVYSHDIMTAEINGQTVTITHTDAQKKCRTMNRALFGS